MVILIHTSKTMYAPVQQSTLAPKPVLLSQAAELGAYVRSITPKQLEKIMDISTKKAAEVHALWANWNMTPSWQRPAVDSFAGDIYSGLQAATWSSADREYAQGTLRILSGLYGVLRPLDGIFPYRLEMSYKLPAKVYNNLYNFWGDKVVATLPVQGPIINLAAKEYGRMVTPYVEVERLIAPKFLTISPKTGEPTFVTVHAKIARGAFAHWLISERIANTSQLSGFTDLGYSYNAALSSEREPVFVCQQFGGIGLSVRLKPT